MPIPIRTASVQQALIPRLGSALMCNTSLAEHAANALRSFSPYKGTLEELAELVSQRLLDDLQAILGPSMTVRLDDGRLQNILLSDLPELADDVMGVLFDAMTISPANEAALKYYAMQQTSLAALRVLLVKYDRSQSEDEKFIMRRIVRDNYPPERYSGWLE